MTAVPFPDHLADGDVRLRRHRPDDVEDVLVQCQDPAMQRWTTVPVPYTREHAVEFLATRAAAWDDGSSLCLAVELGGRFAGTLDLRPEPGAAEVGFGLAPWARGRRALSRALRLTLPWAFEALDLDAVHWRAAVGNWDSRRVAWAVGFRVEGTVRALLGPGQGAGRAGEARRLDGWIGSLLRDDPLRPARPWFEAPTIDVGAARLRPMRDDDALRLAQACADPLAQEWLRFLPSPFGEPQARARIEAAREAHASGLGVRWALADATTDDLLGEVGLYRLADGQCEVGYLLHPDARGRGLATAAARAATEVALAPAGAGGFGLRRVLAVVGDGNAASAAVARAAGFTACGRETAADLTRDGRVTDLLRFERLA